MCVLCVARSFGKKAVKPFLLDVVGQEACKQLFDDEEDMPAFVAAYTPNGPASIGRRTTKSP